MPDLPSPASDDEPEAPTAAEPTAGPLDLTASIFLWLLHLPVAFATYIASLLTAVATDVCAYEECGDPKWIDVAIGTALISSIVLWVGSLVIGIRRVRRDRPSWPVAAWGVALQAVMIVVVLEIGGNAGTVG